MNMEINPNYYQDTDTPVLCVACGHPCHADDAVTDGFVTFCGFLRGNGCADRVVWDDAGFIIGVMGCE